MRIASIMGSPRKKGNTAKILGWIEHELEAKGHEVDRINVIDYRINGCRGCFACKKVLDSPGCPQKDDAEEIFKRIMESDAVIYSSPLYFWDFSSQMKALIDRHVCLVMGYNTPEHESLIRGKRTALVVTCEEKVENNADLIQVLFERFNIFMKTHEAARLVVPFCATPDDFGPEARESAVKTAREIMG